MAFTNKSRLSSDVLTYNFVCLNLFDDSGCFYRGLCNISPDFIRLWRFDKLAFPDNVWLGSNALSDGSIGQSNTFYRNSVAFPDVTDLRFDFGRHLMCFELLSYYLFLLGNYGRCCPNTANVLHFISLHLIAVHHDL